MPALGDVVSRFHGLLEQNGFQEADWAEDLQQRMRQRRLTDSGRLLSPVLRPAFVTQKQVDGLARTVGQLSSIFERLAALIITNPQWLNRLQMLPAEKSLLAVHPGYESFSVASSLDFHFGASGWMLSNVNPCRPGGLAHAGPLAELFCELRLVKDFRHGGQQLGKLPNLERVSTALLSAWKHFGGKGKPVVAVVDWSENAAEGDLLAGLLTTQGMNARFTPPERLAFQDGKLSDTSGPIDIAFRRFMAGDLLTRWELNHPLLEAYRAHAVCVVNNFRAEIGHRRAFLELLTDDAVVDRLPAPDRKLLKQQVLWTRVLAARKVRHDEREVDLLDFTAKNRETLLLLPNRHSAELRTYAGAEMTQAAWEWAIRQAVRLPYVVQERERTPAEPFPFFQYGEFKLRDVEVTLQAQVLGGKMGDCMALLCNKAAGGVTPLGIAPVLMLKT